MFLHLGDNLSISTSELIAILDYETLRKSKTSRRFMEWAERDKPAVHIGGEHPKSFIVTEDRTFYSPISPSTLRKRVGILTYNGSL